MSDLKPCPFCGGEKIKHFGGVYSQEAPVTTCQSCFVQVLGHKNWNNRPAENKIKADAIRQAAETVEDYSVNGEWWSSYEGLLKYADKLEKGEA